MLKGNSPIRQLNHSAQFSKKEQQQPQTMGLSVLYTKYICRDVTEAALSVSFELFPMNLLSRLASYFSSLRFLPPFDFFSPCSILLLIIHVM